MLDIKFIKDNADYVKARLTDRNAAQLCGRVDEVLALYADRNALISATESRKAEQNRVSKTIPAMKKEGRDTSALMEEMKLLSEKIKSGVAELKELDEKIETILLYIPNLPSDSLPVGADESANRVVRTVGTPKEFGFTPLPHWEIGERLNILDPERAAKVTGARFHFYSGLGAKLERAVVNFFLDTHAKAGYTELLPPFIVNRRSMRGTGQLPKFEEDAFKLENSDYFLVPTAEVPVTNYYADEIISFDESGVKKFCAYSACFRAEAGSAGRDTRGLIRQHQFNKVELVKFALPESSAAELETLTADAERVLSLLGLPYRVSLLSTGDLGFSSAMTYDIEVYMPSYGRYVEISSCSNFLDYQARRANIRFKRDPASKPEFVHTLNGSGVAIGRTVAAILENYQTETGEIEIPQALEKYFSN